MLLRKVKPFILAICLLTASLAISSASAFCPGRPCCKKSCGPCCPAEKPVCKKEDPDCRCLYCKKDNEIWTEYGDAWHTVRQPNEYNPGEWETIMLHMRVLGPLPGGHMRKIIEFLSEE